MMIKIEKVTDVTVSKLVNAHTLDLADTKVIYVRYADIYCFLNFDHL